MDIWTWTFSFDTISTQSQVQHGNKTIISESI